VTSELIVMQACALAFTVLWAIAVVRGLIELWAMPRRRARTGRASPNWWVLIPLFSALALPLSVLLKYGGVLPESFDFGPWHPKSIDAKSFLQIFVIVGDGITLVWGPAILAMVAIPIAEAFLNRGFFWHLYLLGILGILAIPFGLVSFGTFLEIGTGQLDRAGMVSITAVPRDSYRGRYGLREHVPACTKAMMQWLDLQTFDEKDIATGNHLAEQLIQLWLNNTFNVMTLDIPSAFGCELTQIEHEPGYFPIAATLAFYRGFVALIMIGMLVRPFVRTGRLP